MNYDYLTKGSIIRLHKKIVETTGGEQGLLNEGILSFVLDLNGVIEWIRRHVKKERG